MFHNNCAKAAMASSSLHVPLSDHPATDTEQTDSWRSDGPKSSSSAQPTSSSALETKCDSMRNLSCLPATISILSNERPKWSCAAMHWLRDGSATRVKSTPGHLLAPVPSREGFSRENSETVSLSAALPCIFIASLASQSAQVLFARSTQTNRTHALNSDTKRLFRVMASSFIIFVTLSLVKYSPLRDFTTNSESPCMTTSTRCRPMAASSSVTSSSASNTPSHSARTDVDL